MKEYFYFRTYHSAKSENDYKMYVTPNGVSIAFRNGKMLDTGISPSNIHPGKTKLSPKEIEEFHKFIKCNNFEIGQLYNKQEFNSIKQKYKRK